MKNRNIIFCLIILISFSIIFIDNFSKRENITSNMESYLKKSYSKIAMDLKILIQKEIDNRTVIIFEYSHKKTQEIYYGYAVFNNIENQKYELEDSGSNRQSLQIFRLKAREASSKPYIIFGGKILYNASNKFKIKNGSKEFIEIFDKNKLFIKYYKLDYDNTFQVNTM